MTSGFAASSANCASIESPPTKMAVRKLENRPSSLITLAVCSASSLVGESTTARAPALIECSFNLHTSSTCKNTLFSSTESLCTEVQSVWRDLTSQPVG